MRGIGKGLLAGSIVAVCLAALPLAVRLGLLILATAPNPRHPPSDLTGEAMGWAIIGLLAGAFTTVIGESISFLHEGGFFTRHKGLIIGSAIGIVLAVFLGVNFAVLQMDSVDGQAITSTNLGMMSGATVSFIGSLSGIVIGATLRRVIIALAS